MQLVHRLILIVLALSLGACTSSPTQSSFTLDPARRAVLTIMPSTDEVLLVNRGPGAVQIDLEDTRLNIYRALSLASGNRYSMRDRTLARVRFSNDSTEPALIEFRLWGGEGFELEISEPPPEVPDDAPPSEPRASTSGWASPPAGNLPLIATIETSDRKPFPHGRGSDGNRTLMVAALMNYP